ncbi:MAG TPA: hypothetical protein VHZ74_05200, partial [Bryobacteraceae bacterium]|nr:hypothetical protein [Bryobacteraceae bacterium]
AKCCGARVSRRRRSGRRPGSGSGSRMLRRGAADALRDLAAAIERENWQFPELSPEPATPIPA